jgi:hypothetical protein
MRFESANRSIVRSVRQGELLNGWLRVFMRERALPLIHQYDVDRLDEEKPDLMIYDVHRHSDTLRFMIVHGGQNLVRAFGTGKGEGRFLDEIVDAERLKSIVPALTASIEARRPVYTVSAVSDVNGVPVSYERLVLPFGAGDRVQQLFVSLKTISVERRFETTNLMRLGNTHSSYLACAVIDRDLDPLSARFALADDVVEI